MQRSRGARRRSQLETSDLPKMLNPHAETVLPDWRALRAARIQAPSRETPAGESRLGSRASSSRAEERYEFYWLVYSEGHSAASLLRQFVEAYLSGASVPTIPGVARPRNRELLPR
jgi:hypothetical protein